VKRRDLIALLGGAAIGWPVRVNAQASGARRIGLLLGLANDNVARGHVAAFKEGLQALGWTEGRNVHFDYHWAGGDPGRLTSGAEALAGSAPDAILVYSTPALAAMKQQTQTIPIVFVQVTDPVSEGLVSSLGHPGGNITGFMSFEYTMGGKYLQLLKEIAPRLERVAVMYNPKTAPGGGLPIERSIQAGARSVAMEVTNTPIRSLVDIEHAMSALIRGSRAGVIFAPDVFNTVHRREIGKLALRYHLPAISSTADIAVDGVLMSYGPDLTVEFRQAAAYVDRILRGTKPADLPIQSPTAFDLAINLRTAEALGLVVPQSLLISANEVIR